ncbi:MAG: NUDIX hydrolase [Chloroflexota bacterium]|nr:NUDIX hydrolase [Chloroflexota bacterium]
MSEEWKVEGSSTIVEGPFLTVELQRVRLPDGRLINDWPIVHARDYVNAVVLNDLGKIMIMDGYKHGLGRSSWQVPGGYLEQNEEPLTTVKGELLEETGYTSDNWQALGSFVVDANRHVGTGHFFIAYNATQVAQPDSDDLEEFRIKWVSAHDAIEALYDGRVALIGYASNLALALLKMKDGTQPPNG